MKLLLHTCCAPCMIYPLQRLSEKGFEAKGFFYNPNIHPFTEYQNRKQAIEGSSKVSGTEIIFPEYNPMEFFREINLKETNPGRCSICWSFRLKKTAWVAKEKKFSYFSTTLLASPYQDQEQIRDIGNELAKEFAVEFYDEDFRPGFKKAHQEAHAQGIYCQKYCGCIYSEIERCRKSEKH